MSKNLKIFLIGLVGLVVATAITLLVWASVKNMTIVELVKSWFSNKSIADACEKLILK